MISIGIDIGSTTSKIVLFDGEKIISSVIVPTGINPPETAKKYLKTTSKMPDSPKTASPS
jgi:activator of 2-hydroxyglutaryl-CoA dehydratase